MRRWGAQPPGAQPPGAQPPMCASHWECKSIYIHTGAKQNMDPTPMHAPVGGATPRGATPSPTLILGAVGVAAVACYAWHAMDRATAAEARAQLSDAGAQHARAEVRQAKANEQQARAEVPQAMAEVRQAMAEVRQAKANEQQAKANEQEARANEQEAKANELQANANEQDAREDAQHQKDKLWCVVSKVYDTSAFTEEQIRVYKELCWGLRPPPALSHAPLATQQLTHLTRMCCHRLLPMQVMPLELARMAMGEREGVHRRYHGIYIYGQHGSAIRFLLSHSSILHQ